MNDKERQNALETAILAAKAAGEIIKDGYGQELEVEVKTDAADRVTQIDREAQVRIEQYVTKAYPQWPTLGEEDEQESSEAKETQWIIDPLDGTSNFIQQLPHVGVSIALEHQGKFVVGVLHFPMLRLTLSATRGQGAFCNGKQIKVRDVSLVQEAVVAEIFSDRQHRGRSVTYPPCLAYRKFGSAVTSLAYLALGSVQAVALRCHVWDIAAASVIIAEAGGRLEWQYDDPANLRSAGSCIATVPGVFAEFKTFVQSVEGFTL